MKILCALSILLFAIVCMAAPGGDGDHGGIPTKTILVQILNLGVAVALLIYFTRKAIANLFKTRHEEFHHEVNKAEAAKSAAEKKKQEISERLQKLSGNQEQDLEKAKSQAEALKKKIVSEAQSISTKLEEDANRTAKYEHLKAIEEIRREMLQGSIDLAKEKMKDEVDGADLKRLRGEFVEKIQVVR